MEGTRRVTAPSFIKNRLLTISAAATLLEKLEQHPSVDNVRLSALTGLGVTKADPNDGVLPTTIRCLEAMDLIRVLEQPGMRFVLTPEGQLVRRHDPYMGRNETVALMALLLAEPYRGAHLFDWVVRGTLSKLRAFRFDTLSQDVNALATAEGFRGAYPNLERVMEHFVTQNAFGRVSPWVEVSAGGGGKRYEPQILLEDLPDPYFWACAFLFLRTWREAFPDSAEATGRDVRTRLLPLLRGVLGIREREKAEELLFVKLHRESLISSSTVTKERITLLKFGEDPLPCVEKMYTCA
jgi:hypothetical protein